MYRHGKRDDNHAKVANYFRSLGFTWHDTCDLGNGFVDGIAGKGNYNILVEIKMEKGKLTKDEEIFHSKWNGPIWIVRNLFDIVDQWYKLTGEMLYSTFHHVRHNKEDK